MAGVDAVPEVKEPHVLHGLRRADRIALGFCRCVNEVPDAIASREASTGWEGAARDDARIEAARHARRVAEDNAGRVAAEAWRVAAEVEAIRRTKIEAERQAEQARREQKEHLVNEAPRERGRDVDALRWRGKTETETERIATLTGLFACPPIGWAYGAPIPQPNVCMTPGCDGYITVRVRVTHDTRWYLCSPHGHLVLGVHGIEVRRRSRY